CYCASCPIPPCYYSFLAATTTPHNYTLSLHDALPISALVVELIQLGLQALFGALHLLDGKVVPVAPLQVTDAVQNFPQLLLQDRDRKSTRLNSSHVSISYAVFCLKIKISEDINTLLII